MEEIKFGTNIFGANGFIIGSCWGGIIGVSFMIPEPFLVQSVVGSYLIFLLVGLLLTRRMYLIINKDGIRVNYLFKRSAFAGWDAIGGYRDGVTKGTGKIKNSGYGIVRKNDVDRIDKMSLTYNGGDYALFVPESCIAASNPELADALQRSFDYYVYHKRQTPHFFLEPENKCVTPFVAFSLFFVWFLLNIITYYYVTSWGNGEFGPIMNYTLVDGGRYGMGHVWIYVIWIIIMGAQIAFFPWLLAIRAYKKVIKRLGLGIVFIIAASLYIIPEQHRIFLNCSEPTTHPIVNINAVIKANYDEMKFDLVYEGDTYEIKMRSVNGAKEGMPIVAKIQKGACNLPILLSVKIPSVNHSRDLAYCYNDLSYKYADKRQYDKALKAIDQAIEINPDMALYYDSKGEHLYRMGKKDEAMRMWQKVVSLEPDYAKQNTELYRLLYGMDK